MTMKTLPCILLLLSLGVASAAPEPEELLRLRKAWEISLSDADRRAKDVYKSKTLAANKLYYEELEEMKSNFMKAENLQAAIAVNKEIEKLKAVHGKQEFEPPKVVKNKPVETQKMDKRKAMLEEMVGEYEAENYAIVGVTKPNDWHFGNITIEQRDKKGAPTVLRFKNRAGKSWLLFPDLNEGVLRTSQDNPYYHNNYGGWRNYEILLDGTDIRGFRAQHKLEFVKVR